MGLQLESPRDDKKERTCNDPFCPKTECSEHCGHRHSRRGDEEQTGCGNGACRGGAWILGYQLCTLGRRLRKSLLGEFHGCLGINCHGTGNVYADRRPW